MCYDDSINIDRKDKYDCDANELKEKTILDLVKIGFKKEFAEELINTLGMRILRNVDTESLVKMYCSWKKNLIMK